MTRDSSRELLSLLRQFVHSLSPLTLQCLECHDVQFHVLVTIYCVGRRPRGVGMMGINCLVALEGEAWHNELLYTV